jgi:hypothetical protein
MGTSKHLNLPAFVYNNSSYFLYISSTLDNELGKAENARMLEAQKQATSLSAINKAKSNMSKRN